MLITNLKAMIVVLTVATGVFIIARPICLRFMAPDDFTRRRNVWFALTVTAFVSPSFWLYALVAAILLMWTARKDRNPVALYALLMFVIPPNIMFEVPIAGINRL